MPTLKDRGMTPKEAAMRFIAARINTGGHRMKPDLETVLDVTLTPRQFDSVTYHLEKQMGAIRDRLNKWIDARDNVPLAKQRRA